MSHQATVDALSLRDGFDLGLSRDFSGGGEGTVCSNTGKMASHLGELTGMFPLPGPKTRWLTKQTQHRLRSEEIKQFRLSEM
jgi:hypothetical protein